MLRYILISMIVGVGAEAIARTLRLWLYRNWIYPIVNVVVMFGLVMGGIAAVMPKLGVLPALAIAFVIGLAYELLNLQALNWWYFPDERVASSNGRVAVILVLSIVWGLVPLITVRVDAAVRRVSLTTEKQSPLDKLGEREARLTQKLHALQQRTQDVEARLEEVRRRKQAVLDKQATRKDKVRRPGTNPVATP